MSILLENVNKFFNTPPTQVLTDITCDIKLGEFVSLVGRSGSGKSTLLYIMSSLDTATSGSIKIAGDEISTFSQKKLHQFRNEHMGFVFQFHYLLPELTAEENILMPARKKGLHHKKRDYAHHLLEEFQIKHKFDRLPKQLSGGEQQRVSIARALIMEPSYLFTDEPTGNLDSANGEIVMTIFKKLNLEKKTTIVMVTHDPDFANIATRQIYLSDGKIT
ncbi:MAG: ABC transporter ATP-binding protein [Candidatus Margulisbacteria bacterium]|nr:ABC transporter ATP-binding protein [Candidatus Margulisiibacteriota bacterium]